MKSFIFSLIITALCTTLATADILLVAANNANPDRYRTLQDAHDAAASGDTIYVLGGTGYGSLTATKPLTWVGPGYFLDQNPNTQANPSHAKCSYVHFESGSEGSIMTGLYSYYYLDLRTDNIVIRRNRLYDVDVEDSLSNIIITQNYIYRYGIDLEDYCANIFITHNWVYSSSNVSASIEMESTCSNITIKNNVIENGYTNAFSVRLHNTVFQNNIIVDGSISASSSYITHNLYGGTDSDLDGNGNQQNVDMSTVFLCYPERDTCSTDGRWQLAPDSPAIGAGYDGSDCGMFGGDEPYVLSGIPAIPSIYFFDAPFSGSASEGLPVRVKIKTNQ